MGPSAGGGWGGWGAAQILYPNFMLLVFQLINVFQQFIGSFESNKIIIFRVDGGLPQS